MPRPKDFTMHNSLNNNNSTYYEILVKSVGVEKANQIWKRRGQLTGLSLRDISGLNKIMGEWLESKKQGSLGKKWTTV